LLEFSDVTFTYAQQTDPAICDISAHIDDGEFVLITGPSGCGKSTLCRCINGLIPSFYGGSLAGTLQVQGKDAFHTPTSEMAKHVGMVFQDPENQLISTDVQQEIVFGLENMGVPRHLIAKRLEEVLDTVGIDHLRTRTLSGLSGGEKQKTAIAAILTLHPEILVLDEPTSELDPKGAEDILQLLKRLNEELGLTVILVEHRIDRVLSAVDRVLILDEGSICYDGNPREWISQVGKSIPLIGIPPICQYAMQVSMTPPQQTIPLTIKEGRTMLSSFLRNSKPQNREKSVLPTREQTPIIDIKHLWVTYANNITALQDITLTINKGEFVSIVGRNASGKTTLAKVLTGLQQPTKGTGHICGKPLKTSSVEDIASHVGLVFQDPNMHLFADTVEQEITFMMNNLGFSQDRIDSQLEQMLTQFHLHEHKTTYPRSLSTGEKQRVALASILAAEPKILILDEPTRGLDTSLKTQLMDTLSTYQKKGGTVLLISHDIELIAQYGQRVILMSEGKIITDGEKHDVLANSLHFSPQMNRLIQPFTKYGYSSDILTVEEALGEKP